MMKRCLLALMLIVCALATRATNAASDGRPNFLVILTDDKNLQPVDNIVPVLNKDAASEPINDVLNKVSAKLTTKELQGMNYSVDWGREDPAKVAQAWLQANGLA
jgi:osmoprotectant transport system substrate-binding protein